MVYFLLTLDKENQRIWLDSTDGESLQSMAVSLVKSGKAKIAHLLNEKGLLYTYEMKLEVYEHKTDLISHQ